MKKKTVYEFLSISNICLAWFNPLEPWLALWPWTPPFSCTSIFIFFCICQSNVIYFLGTAGNIWHCGWTCSWLYYNSRLFFTLAHLFQDGSALLVVRINYWFLVDSRKLIGWVVFVRQKSPVPLMSFMNASDDSASLKTPAQKQRPQAVLSNSQINVMDHPSPSAQDDIWTNKMGKQILCKLQRLTALKHITKV